MLHVVALWPVLRSMAEIRMQRADRSRIVCGFGASLLSTPSQLVRPVRAQTGIVLEPIFLQMPCSHGGILVAADTRRHRAKRLQGPRARPAPKEIQRRSTTAARALLLLRKAGSSLAKPGSRLMRRSARRQTIGVFDVDQRFAHHRTRCAGVARRRSCHVQVPSQYPYR